MAEYLQDFLVLKDGGKVIFSTVSEIIQDQLLFGGFLEAINTIFNIALQDELHTIEGGQYRITFYTKSDYQFIGISSMKVDYNQAAGELKFFANKFVEQFKDRSPENSNNDVRVFQCFTSEFKKSKKEIILERIQRI